MKALLSTLCLLLALSASSQAASLSPKGITAVVVSATTPTVIALGTAGNATYTTQVAGDNVVCLSSNGGAAGGFKFVFMNTSITPSTFITAGQGHYCAASASAQCWGPFTTNTWLHLIGVAGTSSVLVDKQKVMP